MKDEIKKGRRLIKTRTPGIFKRGNRYVVIYLVGGKQKKVSARTEREAQRIKRARETDRDRGELQEQSNIKFREYAEKWIETYRGQGRGFRESTREDYKRNLKNYVYPYFGEKIKLSELTPLYIDRFIGELMDEEKQGKRLSDSTIRNIINPVRSCLATATRQGLIRHNPAHRISLPHRPTAEDIEAESVRALKRDQLDAFLRVVHPRHSLLFELMAWTGLRISEVIALRWKHLKLDGSAPHVKVRRAIVRGRVEPPKSKYGKREVPLDADLVCALRSRRKRAECSEADDLVFPSKVGTALSPENLRRRVVKLAAEEAAVSWMSFHTFRHTCASMLFERGQNVKQVQRWLGHHSASFTLDTYVHFMDDDLGEPLSREIELGPDKVAPIGTATEPVGVTLDEDNLLGSRRASVATN